MMLDQLFRVSNAQAITTASAASTNQVDLEAIIRDVGVSRRLVMDFNIVEAFAVATGTPTLIFSNVLAIAADLVSFPTFLGSSITYTAAELTLGTHIYVPVAPLSTPQAAFVKTAAASGFPQRFFGAFYTLAAGEFSAGKITAHLCIDVVSQLGTQHYKDAVN